MGEYAWLSGRWQSGQMTRRIASHMGTCGGHVGHPHQQHEDGARKKKLLRPTSRQRQQCRARSIFKTSTLSRTAAPGKRDMRMLGHAARMLYSCAWCAGWK